MSATPDIATTKTAVKTVLDAIPDIGVVHDRIRRSNTPEEFADLFIDPALNLIQAWMIECATSDGEEDAAGDLFLDRRGIVIHGYRGFDDEGASTADFEALAALVESALQGSDAIFGEAPLSTDRTIKMTFGKEKLADILCDYVRIEFLVEAEETK